MRDYILTLLVAAAVTYLLTPLVRLGAIKAGVMATPRERDSHVVPMPRGGGVAMYGGLVAGLLVADQIPQLRGTAFLHTGMIQGLLLAGGLLVAIGIVDDKWGISALTKFAGQVAAAAIMVATGTELTSLPEPGGGTFVPTSNEKILLTILVIVGTINAVNFIDGLDGLAAGIVAIAAISFLIYYYQMTGLLNQSELAAPALASAILTGICLGFLPHNFHPARIFMGDTGAMLLGLVLAYAPISSIASLDWSQLAQRVNRYPEIMPLLLPAALLVIPYADLLLAVVRRTRAGLSPFAPDRKHLHHRLIDIGHSQRASVLVMYLWAALFSGSIVWFSLEKTSANHHGSPVLVFVLITAAAVVALVLMSMPRLRKLDSPARRRAQAAASAPGDRTATPAAAAGPAAAVPAGSVPAAIPVPAVTGATGVPELNHDLVSISSLSQPGTPVRSERAPGVNGALAGRGDPPLGVNGAAAGTARPARSVIGSVPPAITGDARRTPGVADVQDADPSGPEHADQSAWQARAESGPTPGNGGQAWPRRVPPRRPHGGADASPLPAEEVPGRPADPAG